MNEANMLPIIFDMKSPFKKNISRITSPVNKSLQIAITDFNCKMNEIKHKKVKENRLKLIKEIDLMKVKPFDIKNVLKSKSPTSNSKPVNRVISLVNTSLYLALEKSVSIEFTSPCDKDILSPNKMNLNVDIKKDEYSYIDQISFRRRKEGNSVIKKDVKDGNNSKLNNEVSLYTNFYRAFHNNEINDNQKKPKNLNYLFEKENTFLNNISLAKRGKDENNLPILYPAVLLKDKLYNSESQKKRYEGICQQLSNLKYILEKGKSNAEYELVKDYLKSNKITDPLYFSTDNLFKIIQFIKNGLLPYPNENLESMLSRIISNQEDEASSFRQKSFSKKLVKIKSTKNIRFLKNKLLNSKGEEPSFVMKIDEKFNVKTETDKELINRLENSLADVKEKVIYKKISRVKSKTRSKKVSREDIDSEFEEDDINDIKKNNKLLELVVLQRAKKKLLLSEGVS